MSAEERRLAKTLPNSKLSLTTDKVIADYRLAYSSRRASVIGRAEVLRGNATFGIFGDGKEVANLAMARAFKPGDWRAGYYRDQRGIFLGVHQRGRRAAGADGAVGVGRRVRHLRADLARDHEVIHL